jgi:hypothetical protein
MCNVVMVNPLSDSNVANMDSWRVVMQEEKNKGENESWQFEDKPRDQKLIDVGEIVELNLIIMVLRTNFKKNWLIKAFRNMKFIFIMILLMWRAMKKGKS